MLWEYFLLFNYPENNYRFNRYFTTFFVIIAYYLGFPGIIIGSTFLLIYMVSLRSIEVPYLSPLIPFKIAELKDSLYRGNLEPLVNSKHNYPEDNN